MACSPTVRRELIARLARFCSRVSLADPETGFHVGEGAVLAVVHEQHQDLVFHAQLGLGSTPGSFDRVRGSGQPTRNDGFHLLEDRRRHPDQTPKLLLLPPAHFCPPHPSPSACLTYYEMGLFPTTAACHHNHDPTTRRTGCYGLEVRSAPARRVTPISPGL